MRVLVTGPLNPVGRAVVLGLAERGHQVRAFGVEPGEQPFAGAANVETYPGWVQVGGSLEPVAVECRAIVHCAPLDEPGDDRQAHAAKVEKGTLYARYAAERELVGAFIVALPAAGRAWSKVLEQARHHAVGTRRLVPTKVVEGADAEAILAAFEQMAAHLPASVQV